MQVLGSNCTWATFFAFVSIVLLSYKQLLHCSILCIFNCALSDFSVCCWVYSIQVKMKIKMTMTMKMKMKMKVPSKLFPSNTEYSTMVYNFLSVFLYGNRFPFVHIFLRSYHKYVACIERSKSTHTTTFTWMYCNFCTETHYGW